MRNLRTTGVFLSGNAANVCCLIGSLVGISRFGNPFPHLEKWKESVLEVEIPARFHFPQMCWCFGVGTRHWNGKCSIFW